MDEQLKKEYEHYVKEVTPTHNLWLQMLKAFLVGGLICTLGQFITNCAMQTFGLDKQTAGSWTSLCLIFLSVLLTGLNLFPPLAKFGGAGALVPITGFANSVAAPAIEFQKEGQVFGIGAKIFTIAGPVILYGIVVSWLLGLIYWISGLLGIGLMP
ncbi:MAG: stage V sporulation protein AC [Acetatifactor sp.]|nr:stage V sporulation protein AC [Acetatifactor sp.]